MHVFLGKLMNIPTYNQTTRALQWHLNNSPQITDQTKNSHPQIKQRTAQIDRETRISRSWISRTRQGQQLRPHQNWGKQNTSNSSNTRMAVQNNRAYVKSETRTVHHTVNQYSKETGSSPYRKSIILDVKTRVGIGLPLQVIFNLFLISIKNFPSSITITKPLSNLFYFHF